MKYIKEAAIGAFVGLVLGGILFFLLERLL